MAQVIPLHPASQGIGKRRHHSIMNHSFSAQVLLNKHFVIMVGATLAVALVCFVIIVGATLAVALVCTNISKQAAP